MDLQILLLDLQMPVKVCKTCGVEKPLEEFYVHPKTKDRRFSSCIPCFREYRKTLYRKPELEDPQVPAVGRWAAGR